LTLAIERAKEGDEQALSYLYLRFAGNVYGYARNLLRDDFEAEDVVQQVFARLMTALGSYEPRGGVPFSAWLLRITRNLAVDQMRMRKRMSTCELNVIEEPARVDSSELRLSLREAIASLPEDQREVVVLRHIAGCSPDEIARRLARSTDSVHGLHHRGRRTLRAALIAGGAAPVTLAA
jgi:RNA polymerase sigma-70 factor (ECF subfamily)